jgi:hypothetical protein
VQLVARRHQQHVQILLTGQAADVGGLPVPPRRLRLPRNGDRVRAADDDPGNMITEFLADPLFRLGTGTRVFDRIVQQAS